MLIAVVAIVAGCGLMLSAVLAARHERERDMDDLVGLVPLPPSTEGGEVEVSPLTGRAVDMAGQVLDRVDRKRSLGPMLERAEIPLRPAEFLIVLGGAALGAAALVLAVTHLVAMALVAGVLVCLMAGPVLRRRINKRRKAFEAQLPDALSLIASSLSAGHTFLRAIQMMCQDSGPPLSDEFGRVVAETRLGDSVTDALERMAVRLQIRDMDMVVQAIRIQQTVGGRLADLLHTLSEVIRTREEVRREVQVLTAEGRMSAYVLAGIVPVLFLLMRTVNPDYIKPLYHGAGLIVLIGCALSVTAGLFVILRMVKIDY